MRYARNHSQPQTAGRLVAPVEGDTCWGTAEASRLAVMIDAEAYFSAALQALRQARHSVWLIGWTFDRRTRLDPTVPGGGSIGDLLHELGEARPDLRIRVLIWNAAGLARSGRARHTAGARRQFRHTPVEFATDGTLPFGASMHRKMLVIDDSLAFCPNDDITLNRWDEPDHRDGNPARSLPSGRRLPPWHANHAVLDGPAAEMLGGIAREMWHSVTGDAVRDATARREDLWPAGIAPLLRDVEVAVTGTAPLAEEGRTKAGLRHVLRAIEAARRSIYVEATYLTSTAVRAALAARLREAGGPEVVLINGRHGVSFYDRAVMDPPRRTFLQVLREADGEGRLSVHAPRSPGGQWIKVHSKLMIVDDRLLRIGSSNLSNRSGGYDAECDIAAEAPDEGPLRGLRQQMIGHFLGLDGAAVEKAEAETGGIGAAIRRLDPEGRRLPRLVPHPPLWRGWLSGLHLGDPPDSRQAWQPWRREA